MTRLEEDIFDIEEAMYSGFYDYQLYQNTNGDLKNVLSVTDFSDKDVLSVMGSADQVFSAYYLGAKSVDTFDKNRFTYYYFYLKKWCMMKYKNIKIPNDLGMILEALELCDNSEEEKNAYSFWRKVIEYCIFKNREFSNNRYLFSVSRDGWSVPYFDDEDEMEKIISSKKANFTHCNIFLPMNCTKQYNIIILSNILEFLREDNIDIVISNLKKLLKDNGVIICSNVCYDKAYEKEQFEANGFLYQSGADGIISARSVLRRKDVCYTYKKV